MQNSIFNWIAKFLKFEASGNHYRLIAQLLNA